MFKILYIAGYGRCGSTALDIILGAHPDIIGVGEVTFLLEDWLNSVRRCSCGLPYQRCDFWGDLFSSEPPLTEMAEQVRKIERRSFVLRLLLGAISRQDYQVYRSYQKKVLAHIEARTKSSIIVDSSKSARLALGRFFALSKLAGQEVYVLHLVRDGFAVMESQIVTGDNWVLEGRSLAVRWPALRTAFGWVITNIWVPLLGRFMGANRYMLLRFEDFIEDPAGALQAIGEFSGFDPSVLIELIHRDDYFHVGHMVGGNRIRLGGKIKLKRASREKYGSRLKPYQRAIFGCLGGWLQRLYGYR